MKKCVYSPEQLEEALRMSEEIGPTAAARKLGLPPGTVFFWRHAKSKQQHSVEPEAESISEPGDGQAEHPESATELSEEEPKKKRVAKNYTPSQRAEILEYAAKHGVTEASREFDVTRFSIYEWRRKAQLHSEGKLKDNPVAGGDDKDPKVDRDRRILKEWKAHPGLGPSQVRNQLRRQGMKVSSFQKVWQLVRADQASLG